MKNIIKLSPCRSAKSIADIKSLLEKEGVDLRLTSLKRADLKENLTQLIRKNKPPVVLVQINSPPNQVLIFKRN